MKGKLEWRRLGSIEVRKTRKTDTPILRGYAAKFGMESQPLFDEDVIDGPFVEVISKDAFTRTLNDNPDVRALYNHNTDYVLGRTSSGTLELSIDDTGLLFNVRLSTASYAIDAATAIKRRDVDGCSFGFMAIEDSIELRGNEPAIRTLLDIDLFEISTGVAFPAYTDTSVEVRSSRTKTRHYITSTNQAAIANARKRQIDFLKLKSDC